MKVIENILLLEAEGSSALEAHLRAGNYHVVRATSALAAHELSLQAPFDLIIVDDALGDTTGGWSTREAQAPVIILAAPGSSAIQSARQLNCGLALKPVAPAALDIAIAQAARLRQAELVQRHGTQAGEWLGAAELRQTVRKIARTEATVLIQGERGSGKSFIARQLHALSPRVAGACLALDCTAFPEGVVSDELFGASQPGLLDLAHHGTLILEEVSALAPEAQEQLLQFLSDAPASGARLIATTSRDLAKLCERGEFREDLFIRLGIVPITIPPLRERKADIRPLADHFRQRYSRKHGLDVLALSPATVSVLECHPWPGNARELEQIMEQAAIAAESGVIEPGHLRLQAKAERAYWPASKDAIETLADCEKRHIFAVLERCQWNRTHAAEKLAISVRTLRNKLKEYREESSLAPELAEANQP